MKGKKIEVTTYYNNKIQANVAVGTSSKVVFLLMINCIPFLHGNIAFIKGSFYYLLLEKLL